MNKFSLQHWASSYFSKKTCKKFEELNEDEIKEFFYSKKCIILFKKLLSQKVLTLALT